MSGNILATDLDSEVLEKAGMGIYSNKVVQGLSPEQLKKYFENQGSYYQAKDELKKMISFQKHDLLRDLFPRDYDLILCCNVVIYLQKERNSSGIKVSNPYRAGQSLLSGPPRARTST